MRFFDRDFLKFTFQFLGMVALGVAIITFVAGLNHSGEVTAGVVDGR